MPPRSRKSPTAGPVDVGDRTGRPGAQRRARDLDDQRLRRDHLPAHAVGTLERKRPVETSGSFSSATFGLAEAGTDPRDAALCVRHARAKHCGGARSRSVPVRPPASRWQRSADGPAGTAIASAATHDRAARARRRRAGRTIDGQDIQIILRRGRPRCKTTDLRSGEILPAPLALDESASASIDARAFRDGLVGDRDAEVLLDQHDELEVRRSSRGQARSRRSARRRRSLGCDLEPKAADQQSPLARWAISVLVMKAQGRHGDRGRSV